MITRKEVAMADSAGTASLEASLRLGNGLNEHDRERVLRRLAGLDARLRSFRAGVVGWLVTVKERETRSQRTTLEATIANWPRLVATSMRPRLDEAPSEGLRSRRQCKGTRDAVESRMRGAWERTIRSRTP